MEELGADKIWFFGLHWELIKEEELAASRRKHIYSHKYYKEELLYFTIFPLAHSTLHPNPVAISAYRNYFICNK